MNKLSMKTSALPLILLQLVKDIIPEISPFPTALSFPSLPGLSHSMQMLYQRCYNIAHLKKKNNTKFAKSKTFFDPTLSPPDLL